MKFERILAHSVVLLVCIIVCVAGAMLGLRGTPLMLFGVVTVTIGYTVLDVVHHDGPVEGDLVRSKVTSNLIFVSIVALIISFFVEPVEDQPKAASDATPSTREERK